MPDVREEAGAGDVPCPPMFATETMAELSARQGRTGDALAIYRHLLRTGESEGEGGDRLVRWKARLAELEGSGHVSVPAAPAGPPVARAAPPGPRAPAPRAAAAPARTLVIREPVRSGQVVYADGRDLIVLAPVHPGAQLLADGHIHVYAPLKGRAVAGAQGARDVEVFCLALEAELVGVDTGYVVAEDVPGPLWGAAVRVFLTPEGICTVAPLLAGKPSARPR
ncbi:MAG TPA: septum site-determining protein MinC [Polyangia bacterium]|nr:septum site-determining protein MinC [Polyangia bacterium]